MCNVGAHAAKFRKIFGADQFDAHFQTSADFMTAVQGKQNLFQQRISMSRDALKGSDALSDSIKTGGEEDVVSNFVLCTSHVGGESMRLDWISISALMMIIFLSHNIYFTVPLV